MKTIVFIGCNKSGTSRDALIAASEMGFHTVLFTDRKKFLRQRGEFTEVNELFFFENVLDKNLLLTQLRALQMKGKEILACISLIDPFVTYAAQVSTELGLTSVTAKALKNIEDKIRVRDMLKDLPFSPPYQICNHQKESIHSIVQKHKGKLPFILKSPASNGSKDVFYVETKSEFKKGLTLLQKKYPHTPILLEEFIEGPQYLIEVMVYKGDITLVAIIEQEIQRKERFIVTGYLYPAQLQALEHERLKSIVTTIVRKFDLTNGTCHLEMRKNGDEWKLIEINPRVSGGAMNRIILEGTGMNYVKEIIKLHLGEKPDLQQTQQHYVYARFLTIDSKGRLLKVTGKNRALKREGIKEVYIKPKRGTILSVPYSLGDRYAYVIAVSDTPNQARNIALEAAQEIKFFLEPL